MPVSAVLRDANLKSGRGEDAASAWCAVCHLCHIHRLFVQESIYTDIYRYTPMHIWNLLSFEQRGKTGVYISVFEKQVPPLPLKKSYIPPSCDDQHLIVTYPCFLCLFPICIYFTFLLFVFLSSLIFLHFSFIFSVFFSSPLNILYP